MRAAGYLYIFAVHPATQGRGIGAALINETIKSARHAIYLESLIESNRTWYEARLATPSPPGR